MQARLLFPSGELRSATNAVIDVLAILAAQDVWLEGALGERDHRNTPTIADANLLIERINRRKHVAPENRVRHPALQTVPPDAGDGAVIFDTEQDASTSKIRKGHDRLGQLFGADLIAHELNIRVLALRDHFR